MKVFLTHTAEELAMYFRWAVAPLERLGEVVRNPLDRPPTTAELIAAARDCDIVVAHRSTPGEAALFDALPNLLALLRPSVDIGTIDLPAASRNGVLVANAMATFGPSTAEMALALMLDLARNVTASALIYRQGGEPPLAMGVQLRGSTAGIIGYGTIGRCLADILLAMGMRVLVCDPYRRVDKPGIAQVDLDTLLRESDFVLPLAVPTPQTENMIDRRALALMKPTAFLVNCSRGALVDEAAVAAALDAGRLAGLGMDVGRGPDQRPSAALARRPGVVATPHLGGTTVQAAEPQALSAVEQVAAILAGEMPPRAINPGDAARLRAFWRGRAG